MFACRIRLLLGVRSANHGILPRGLTPHASSPWHGAAAQRHYRQQLQGEDEREESKAVKVTVWWDLSCRLPPRVNPSCVGPRLTAALRRAGIRGPVEITAFGDVTRIPPAEQEALTYTGVALSHVPSYGGKDGCHQSFMPDLVSWIAQNPPPAHFLLISGDEDFANILHRLRMSNYNVLLSCPNAGSKMLHTAATLVWIWEPLVKGVVLEPKCLNQPPDGLSSWYGQYRDCGHDLVKQNKPMALPQNTKEPKVPISVLIGIKQVLHFYPEGISVYNLRAELRRMNVSVKRKTFGLRKFCALLKAMPDVVKFIDPLPGDTKPAVVGVFKRSEESSEESSFNGIYSAQCSIEQKHHSESESEELSSWEDQPSSSELQSCT